MKSKIFILGLLLGTASITAFAQKTKPTTTPVKTTIHLAETAHVLFVDNDVSVILTDDDTNDVTVEGYSRDVKALRVQMNDGNLSLAYAYSAGMNGVKVYVPTKYLSKINLSGKTVLRSERVLQNQSLKIVLESEGIINLSSTGKVLIEGSNDFDFIKSR